MKKQHTVIHRSSRPASRGRYDNQCVAEEQTHTLHSHRNVAGKDLDGFCASHSQTAWKCSEIHVARFSNRYQKPTRYKQMFRAVGPAPGCARHSELLKSQHRTSAQAGGGPSKPLPSGMMQATITMKTAPEAASDTPGRSI